MVPLVLVAEKCSASKGVLPAMMELVLSLEAIRMPLSTVLLSTIMQREDSPQSISMVPAAAVSLYEAGEAGVRSSKPQSNICYYTPP